MGPNGSLHLNKQAPFPVILGVVGTPPHWADQEGILWAYEPYVRELRIWADLFAGVVMCGPIGEGPMRGNLAPYHRDNIQWNPVSYTMGYGRRAMLKRLSQLPGMMVSAYRIISNCDLVHLRSPDHFTLIGSILVRCMKRRSITKWAGENAGFKGERLPSRLNRWIESRPNQRHPVLVYGPSKRPHQVSFLPALMCGDELERARSISKERRWSAPWSLLSVGRLEPVKGFDLAIEGLGQLRRDRPDLEWHYILIGDGTANQFLKSLVTRAGIGDRVTFTGSLPFEEVQTYYASSHVVIMPGIKEGWPKVVAEAWAHGAVPLAASSGLVPWILGEDEAGVAFAPTPIGLAAALEKMLSEPGKLATLSQRLVSRAEDLSIESFRASLERILIERCCLAAGVGCGF